MGSKRVERDPETGEWVKVDMDSKGKAGGQGFKGEVSYFDDDPVSSQSASTFVMLGNSRVWFNELSRGDFKALNARSRDVTAEMKAIEKESAAGPSLPEGVSPEDLPDEELDAIAAEFNDNLEARSEKVLEQKDENDLWMLEKCIVDWELTRPDGEKVPYSPEALRKLRTSHRAILAEQILQKSVFGKADSDFLAQPSNRTARRNLTGSR